MSGFTCSIYFTLFVFLWDRETKRMHRWNRLIIRSRSNCVLGLFYIHREMWSGKIFSRSLSFSSYTLIPVEVGVCYRIQLDYWTGSLTYVLTRRVFFCLFELRLNNCRRSLLLYSSVCAHTDFVIRKCMRASISQIENNDQSL